WALFQSYRLLGPEGLVILKALLMVALAALMLSFRSSREQFWLAPLLTALVFVVITPRLLLQPTLISFVLLGLSLWLLWRGGWKLFLRVCLLGGKVGRWFWLGRLFVALFWVGQRLSNGEPWVPAWLIPAFFLVCLLNPHLFHSFLSPPVELSLVP